MSDEGAARMGRSPESEQGRSSDAGKATRGLSVHGNRRLDQSVTPGDLLRLYNSGDTLQSLGDRFGVTRERIRQILSTLPDYAARKPVREHGKRSAYANGCRCATCRAGYALYQKNRRERLWGTEPRQHGTYTAYDWHGCRCDVCVESNSERVQRRRVR